MSLEAAFRELVAGFGRMRAALDQLGPEVAGDPELEALVARLIPILDDALAAGRRGLSGAAAPVNLDWVTAMLPRCQERFNTAMAIFREELASPARAEALAHTGRDRLVFTLGACQQPFFDSGWRLMRCGRELAAQIRLRS